MARSRRGVSSFAPARRAFVELLREPLYYRAEVATGATTQTFFQNAVGQAALTYLDTNMESAGRLSSPKSFDCYGTSILTPAGIAEADLLDLVNQGFCSLFIGTKFYMEQPWLNIPRHMGVDGAFAVEANVTTTDLEIGNGVPEQDNIYPLWVPEKYLHAVKKVIVETGKKVPLIIPPEQLFICQIDWPNGVTLAASRNLTWYLHGVQKREVM